MQSLQSRLGTGLLLSLFTAFSVLAILVSINFRFLAEDYIASRLEHDSENLLSAIQFDQQGMFSIDGERTDLVYSQPFSGHYYVISSNTQVIYSRSLWDQQLQHLHMDIGQQQRGIQTGPEDQSLLVLSRGYSKQGHHLSISVAEDLKPVQNDIDQLLYGFVIIAVGILLLLVILQALILHYSLKPLARIRNELQSLEQGQVDKLGTDVPGEMRPLINEVNHLLAIMAQRLTRSRDALSDLAHAIKKPLTVIRQFADRDEIPEASRHILLERTDDIYQLTDRILKRARLAGHSHSGRLFSFDEDLPALFKTLDMMYADKILKISTEFADNISCPVDREDMLELLGNLLDNAYKWAEKTIIFTASYNADLHISIEDDGPGADPERINELSQRGVRLDEKIAGHGFGLAIASDIITDYEGQIRFQSSTRLGGFRVDVLLPVHRTEPR